MSHKKSEAGGKSGAQKWASVAVDDEVETNPEETEEKPVLTHQSYEELLTQLATAEAKANEYWDKLVRLQAEFDNLRRRNERDLAQAHKFALERCMSELLPVVDNLERTLEQKGSSDLEVLYTGVELTLKLLRGVLEKFGVKPVDPLGESFDPTLHEAMSMQEQPGQAPGTVLSVLQKGYLLHDRLLRPALVVVVKTV